MSIPASGSSHKPDAVLYRDVLCIVSIHVLSIILLDVQEIYDIIAVPNYR